MNMRSVFRYSALLLLTVGLLAIVVVARTVPYSPAVAFSGTTWLFSMDPAPTGTFHSPSNHQYLMYQDTCPSGTHCLIGGSDQLEIKALQHYWFGSASSTTNARTYTDPIPATTWTFPLNMPTYEFKDPLTFTVGYVLASSPTTLYPLGSTTGGCTPVGSNFTCALTLSISGSAETPSGPYYIVFDMWTDNAGKPDADMNGYSLTTCLQIPEGALIAAPIALLIPGMLALRVKLNKREDSD